uniref:Uncharacterized protein n=1 Tax=Anguilla anguilla TaxID=7936 RepID=A0A0E9PIS3_ANGAN
MRFPLNAETLSIFRSRLNTLILTEQWLPETFSDPFFLGFPLG